MSMIKKPKLVVFDLGSDYTLWPFRLGEYAIPPFRKRENNITDVDGRIVKCYPEVPDVFKYLSNEQYSIGIASRSDEIEGAEQLLVLFGLHKYITHKEIYPDCKIRHFESIRKKSKVELNEMVFFDDEIANVSILSKSGVFSVLVTNGVTMKLVKDTLIEFADNSR